MFWYFLKAQEAKVEVTFSSGCFSENNNLVVQRQTRPQIDLLEIWHIDIEAHTQRYLLKNYTKVPYKYIHMKGSLFNIYSNSSWTVLHFHSLCFFHLLCSFFSLLLHLNNKCEQRFLNKLDLEKKFSLLRTKTLWWGKTVYIYWVPLVAQIQSPSFYQWQMETQGGDELCPQS